MGKRRYIAVLFGIAFSVPVFAHATRYGERLCEQDGYHCLAIRAETREVSAEKNGKTKKIKRRFFIAENLRTRETQEFEKLPTWNALWPDAAEQEIVQKVNRLNIPLMIGLVIAVPDTLHEKSVLDFSPFPEYTEPRNEKLLVWDPNFLAWGAYGPDGALIAWGPGVGGMDFCPDILRSCRTLSGTFRILEKYGPGYRSGKYPIGECKGGEPGRPGCAPMPYFMKFHRGGLGFHGSIDVPGRHASHGCVRIFEKDAEWLSKNFVEKGTKVIIIPYSK